MWKFKFVFYVLTTMRNNVFYVIYEYVENTYSVVVEYFLKWTIEAFN